MAENTSAWFEISSSGWRVQSAGRPLAALIYEGIQNAFDQEVTRVEVTLDGQQIVIEDDGRVGFADPKLAYTVFLTNKADSAVMRGRHGRGLKELISAVDTAVIETIDFEMRFGKDGRHVSPSKRKRGTRLTLARASTALEIDQAVATLRRLIAPQGVDVRINGSKVQRPKRFARLTDCLLDTVVKSSDDGAARERILERETSVTLLRPREALDEPHIFEMGLPVQPVRTPWHIDVGQRIPLDGRRDCVDETYRLRLLALLFESLVAEHLSDDQLKDDWVAEVISRCVVSSEALDAYVRRALPASTVLPTSAALDDRARQLGANVLDLSAMSRGQREAMERVLPRSEAFVQARQQAQEKVHATQPYEQRAVAFLAQLAKRILGRRVSVVLVRQPPVGGIVESATFHRQRFEMTLNIEGKMNLREPMSQETLGIFFHELAHAFTAEHDRLFIEKLEEVAGIGAVILAHDGRMLAENAGISFTHPSTHAAAARTEAHDQGMTQWPTPVDLSIAAVQSDRKDA